MKLHRITLACFRGFPFEATLDFGGKNLLLYGENGSGKSTLFHALREFFPLGLRRRGIEELRNLFLEPTPAPTAPPAPTNARVELVFEGETVVGDPNSVGQRPFRWDRTTPRQPLTGLEALIARQLGALDYRALLETHFVQRKEESVDILTLLIEGLIGDRSNQLTQRPFREEWEEFHRLGAHDPPAHPAPSRSPRDRAALNTLNQTMLQFVQGLEGELRRSPTNPAAPDGLQEKANRLLTRLDPGLEIQLAFRAPVYSPALRRIVDQGAARLTATLNRLPLPNPASFLNEARLTAIGLSLYLAALQHCVPTAQRGALGVPRLLVLDDVLIGLDLSHRLPLLRLLADQFADWQVLLFTHDRAWFDLAQLQVAQRDDWCSYEMQARPIQLRTPAGDDLVIEIPLVKPPEGTNIFNHYLSLADGALNPPMPPPGVPPRARDERTAGLYTRVAFESKLKSYCSDRSVQVSYKLNPGELKTKDFLEAIERRLKWDGTFLRAYARIERVKMFLDGVLNPLAHCHPVTLHQGEIEAAITAVRELDFGTGRPNYLLRARHLLPGLPAVLSDAELIEVAVCLRVSFEVSVRDYLVRRNGQVGYRHNWSDLPPADLWAGAKERLRTETNGPALAAGLDAHPVFHREWTFGFVRALQVGTLRAAFVALHDPASTANNPTTLLDAYR